METKEDKRSARSKRLIVQALRELILEKDYDSISVSDIVERADIGRATFYAHFEDKVALGRTLFGMLLAQIEAQLEAEMDAGASVTQHLMPSRAIFKIAAEKHRWFKVNATTPEIGLTMLIDPLIARMVGQLETLGVAESPDGIPHSITARYLASGFVALLTDWVVHDMPESPEVMDQIFQSLAEPTLKRLVPA